MNNNDKKGPSKDSKNLKFYAIYFVAILIMVTVFNYFMNDIRNKRQNYNEFYAALQEDRIQEITLDESTRTYIYTMKEGDELAGLQLYTGMISGDEEILAILKTKDINYYSKPIETASPLLTLLISWILPLGLLLFLGSYLMKSMDKRGGNMMSFGKNTAKLYESDTGVTFKDVAGQEEAKESLIEIVDFLHNPQKYVDIGARLPKGALLVGPPGTGKTLLAKAVAGEAKVPFFSLSGSAFVEMFVGMGAARVRDLFKEAMLKAPCIIFIDEIDAIGKSRETGGLPGGNDEREQTLNQLLAEMDGFDSSKGIVLLAATNRPEVLDKALLRPGRFDRRIIVDAPDLRGREAILKVHSKDVKMGDDVDLFEIAKGTPGAVGADLANMINEAALRAVKSGRQYVKQEDLQESIEVVIAGQQKKDRIMSTKEKRIVAFHEIGHALVAAMQKGSDPVLKITIIPRTMGSLGYTMQVPEDDKYLMSKDEMLNEIAVLFGGRAAEEVEFDSITTGASNDIERATQMARRMVSMYGMSESFDMMGLESIRSQYLDGRAVLNVSDETATKIDIETLNIIRACHEKAKQILMGNKELMTVLAEQLLEKETMTGNEFMTVVRQFKGDAFGRKLPAPEIVETILDETGEVTVQKVDPEETEMVKDPVEGDAPEKAVDPDGPEAKDLLEDLKETLREEQEKGPEKTEDER